MEATGPKIIRIDCYDILDTNKRLIHLKCLDKGQSQTSAAKWTLN